MTPTPGRIVHFVPPQECTAEKTLAFYPAIITQVNQDGSCELATFGPNSLYFQHNIQISPAVDGQAAYAEGTVPAPGCFNWPPRN